MSPECIKNCPIYKSIGECSNSDRAAKDFDGIAADLDELKRLVENAVNCPGPVAKMVREVREDEVGLEEDGEDIEVGPGVEFDVIRNFCPVEEADALGIGQEEGNETQIGTLSPQPFELSAYSKGLAVTLQPMQAVILSFPSKQIS